jgi:hypothetical protein
MATRQKNQKSRSSTTSRPSQGRGSEKADKGGRAGGSRETQRARADAGSTMSGGNEGGHVERRGASGPEGR